MKALGLIALCFMIWLMIYITCFCLSLWASSKSIWDTEGYIYVNSQHMAKFSGFCFMNVLKHL